MPPRCYLGCPSDLAGHLHVFPNPDRFPDQFHKWVKIVGGQLNTPADYAFYRKKRLCDRHFTEKDRNRNNRLNALAVPSLFLRAQPAETLSTKTSRILSEIDMNVPLLQSTALIGSLEPSVTCDSAVAPAVHSTYTTHSLDSLLPQVIEEPVVDASPVADKPPQTSGAPGPLTEPSVTCDSAVAPEVHSTYTTHALDSLLPQVIEEPVVDASPVADKPPQTSGAPGPLTELSVTCDTAVAPEVHSTYTTHALDSLLPQVIEEPVVDASPVADKPPQTSDAPRPMTEPYVTCDSAVAPEVHSTYTTHSLDSLLPQVIEEPVVDASPVADKPPQTSGAPGPLTGSRVLSEHNYFKTQHPKENNLGTFAFSTKELAKRKSYKEDRQIRNLKQQIRFLQKRCSTFKKRLANAMKMSSHSALQKVTKQMTLPAKLFTKMQFSQTSKKPSGRRFTLEEKILSLSFYKRSPKCYSLLKHCFTLPSPKTLKSLLAQVKLGPGINEKIFEKISKTVREMSVEDRLCTVIFDEMSLSPQLHFDMLNDKLKGFVSTITNINKNLIADHVLVFMVKGIKANFKQPVAYYFTNALKTYELKMLITEVIKKIQATGLIPLCSVCDQGTVNVGAINSLVQDTKSRFLRLGKEWRYDFYQINKQKIIPLYDVPHLLKGLRNNMITKDLIYVDADDSHKQKIIKWHFFENIYEADKSLGGLRLLHKITEEHFNPEKMKKMRVKTAVQLLSHRVAVAAEHLTARGLLNIECRNLIPFVSLIDNLFDSLNSNTFHIPDGKIYKGCVRRTSPHHQLWTKAKILLKSVKFIAKKKTGDKIRFITGTVPSTNNFIKTIEGFEALWSILHNKYLFDSMMTRHFNQDPIENFFGNIRSYGARNNSPNAIAFEGAFKALLLNNYNSPHSINSNCEGDENMCLQSFDFFVTEKHTVTSNADIPEENFVMGNLHQNYN